MSEKIITSPKAAGNAVGSGPLATTRVDAPHAPPSPPDHALPDDLADWSPALGSDASAVENAEQMFIQAGQLAALLQRRQRELDRREAQLHARSARLEEEVRELRLRHHEKEAELTERDRMLDEQEAALQKRAAAAEEAETRRRQIEQQWREREQQLQRQQKDLERQQTETLAMQKQLARAQQTLAQQSGELDQQRRAFEEKARQFAEGSKSSRQCLLEAEKSLREEHEKAENERRAVAAEREQILDRSRVEHAAVARRQQQHETELEIKREQLARRSEHLRRRSAALDQLEQEIGLRHRETLEARLAAEQLNQRLRGESESDEVERHVCEIDDAIRQSYEHLEARLAQQRAELAEAATQLDMRLDELEPRRRELAAWFAQQSRQLDDRRQQCARQQRELDERFRQCAEREAAWRRERGELIAQVRRLEATVESAQLPGAA
jgi:chromosome segregation ATPase